MWRDGGALTMIDCKAYYDGRGEAYRDELIDEIRRNAEATVARANELLKRAGFGYVRSVNSGWRPQPVNTAMPNASATRHHLTGRAIDLPDPGRTLAAWCVADLDGLAVIGLWLEGPRWSYDKNGEHWAHVRTVPTRSGRRVLSPSTAPAIDPDFPVTWA